MGENKLTLVVAVNKNPVQAGRAQVPGRIILSVKSRGENRIHEHVLECVGLGGDDVAKLPVNRPDAQAARNPLLPVFQAVSLRLHVMRRPDGAALVHQVDVLGENRCRTTIQQAYRGKRLLHRLIKRMVISIILTAMAAKKK